MLYWLFIASIVQPCVSRIRLRMAFQMKHFHDAIPDRLPVKYFSHWHAGMMRSLPAVQLVNRVPEFVNVTHAVASISSPTFQNEGVTPAAIAGVKDK